MTRRASCSCGQLHLKIEGEPSRIAMCHCLECQRRTGAVISNQARFRREQVTTAAKTTAWTRTAESGNAMTFHFRPTCGSTVSGLNAFVNRETVHRRHQRLRRCIGNSLSLAHCVRVCCIDRGLGTSPVRIHPRTGLPIHARYRSAVRPIRYTSGKISSSGIRQAFLFSA